MSGDPTKASVWANADVYVAPVGTAAPTDTWSALNIAFEAVGLLDGEEGFTESREDEVAEHFAWGGILVKKTKSKHQRSIKFSALETNDVVFALVNPGSTRGTVDGVTTSVVKVPISAEVMVILETRDGAKIKRRVIDRAEVGEVGEVKDSETEMTAYEITLDLYPDPTTSELYTDLEGPDEDPTP